MDGEELGTWGLELFRGGTRAVRSGREEVEVGWNSIRE